MAEFKTVNSMNDLMVSGYFHTRTSFSNCLPWHYAVDMRFLYGFDVSRSVLFSVTVGFLRIADGMKIFYMLI